MLALTGLTLADMAVIELNEARRPVLSVTRSLGFPDDAEHVNPNGGAFRTSVGHERCPAGNHRHV